MNVRCVILQGLGSARKGVCCFYRLAIVTICWCLFSVDGDFDVPFEYSEFGESVNAVQSSRLRLFQKSEGRRLDVENE